MDVGPNVELGPIRQRKHAHALARPDPGVSEMPELWTLPLRVPVLRDVAEGKYALLGARLLLVAARPAERRVETMRGQRLLQRLGLHDVGVERAAMSNRRNAVLHALLVGMDDQ